MLFSDNLSIEKPARIRASNAVLSLIAEEGALETVLMVVNVSRTKGETFSVGLCYR